MAAWSIRRPVRLASMAAPVCLLAAPARAGDLTLDAALRTARRSAPEILAARDGIAAAEGRRTQAGLPRANPEIAGQWADDRLLDNGGERRRSIEIAQELELGGQRGLRVRLADAEIGAARLHGEAFTRSYLASVAEAFCRVLWAQRRTEIGRQILTLNQDLRDASSRRLAAGDTSEVDHNLIAGETERTRADAVTAAVEEAVARAELNRLLGLPVRTVTRVLGRFPGKPPQAGPGPGAADRLDVRAARTEVDARQAEIALLRREAVPSLRLAVGVDDDVSVVEPHDHEGDPALAQMLGRSRDRDTLLGVRLALALPVFNRNQGLAREAAARRAAAEHRAEALERSVDAEVAAAGAALDGAGERLRILAGILPGAGRNLDLLTRAYSAGQIGAPALLAARDRSFRARLDHLEAQCDHAIARLRLARALGQDPSALADIVSPAAAEGTP